MEGSIIKTPAKLLKIHGTYKNIDYYFPEDPNSYKLLSKDELLSGGMGCCWDTTIHVNGDLKSANINSDIFYIEFFGSNIRPTHTFNVIYPTSSHKYLWIEYSWNSYKGIKEYSTLYSLLLDVHTKFMNDIKRDHGHTPNGNQECFVTKIEKIPPIGSGCNEFMNIANSHEDIDIDSLQQIKRRNQMKSYIDDKIIKDMDRKETILFESLDPVRKNKIRMNVHDNIMEKIDSMYASNKNRMTQISDTRGDISKLPMIGDIKDLLSKSESSRQDISIINNAIFHLENNSKAFIRAYKSGHKNIIKLYEYVVLSILKVVVTLFVFKSVGSILSGVIEMDIALKALKKYNKYVETGDLYKELESIPMNMVRTESIDPFWVVMGIGGTILSVYIIREMIYLYYYSRMQVSDYLSYIALKLDLNKEANPKNLDAAKRKEVVKKQDNIIKKMNELSDKIAVDSYKVEKKVKEEVAKDDKKVVATKTETGWIL